MLCCALRGAQSSAVRHRLYRENTPCVRVTQSAQIRPPLEREEGLSSQASALVCSKRTPRRGGARWAALASQAGGTAVLVEGSGLAEAILQALQSDVPMSSGAAQVRLDLRLSRAAHFLSRCRDEHIHDRADRVAAQLAVMYRLSIHWQRLDPVHSGGSSGHEPAPSSGADWTSSDTASLAAALAASLGPAWDDPEI